MMRTRTLFRTRTFGRRAVVHGVDAALPQPSLGEDAKLFAMTFMGGFLFMAIYLG